MGVAEHLATRYQSDVEASELNPCLKCLVVLDRAMLKALSLTDHVLATITTAVTLKGIINIGAFGAALVALLSHS